MSQTLNIGIWNSQVIFFGLGILFKVKGQGQGVSRIFNICMPLEPLIFNIATRELAQNVRVTFFFDCASYILQLLLTSAEFEPKCDI